MTESPLNDVAPAPQTPHPSLTITPNNPNPVPTERYVRLLVVLTIALLMAMAAYLALRALSIIHHTILLFALAAVLAYALDPIVEVVRGKPVVEGPVVRDDTATAAETAAQPTAEVRPVRRQRPRWLGVLAVFIALFAVVAVGLSALGHEAVHQGQMLTRSRAQIMQNANDRVDYADHWLRGRGVPFDLAGTVRHPPESLRRWGQDAAKSGLAIAADTGKSVFESVIVLLITAYFLLFSEEMRALTTRAAPERLRSYVSAWQDDVNHIMGGFVRGQAVLALVIGAGAAAACLLLGLHFWLLIGAFVVIASLIPVFGPYLGALPAIASAILTPAGVLSPVVRIVLVVLLFIAINEIGSKVLYPKLVGKALGLHEVLVLFVLFAGLEIGGIVGVLFAAPLTALAGVTVLQLSRIWTGQEPMSFTAVEREISEVTQPSKPTKT